MGLSGYGKNSELYDNLKKWIKINHDGSYQIHPYFIEAMFYLNRGREFFHWENRNPSDGALKIMPDLLMQFGKCRTDKRISEKDQNLAWAVQEILNQVVLELSLKVLRLSDSDRLCLSGGVALNSVTNGFLIKSNIAKEIFFFPTSGDEGQPLGRLLFRLNHDQKTTNTEKYSLNNIYFGPRYTKDEIKDSIEAHKECIEYTELDEEDICKKTAYLISEGNIVGWWQDRSELGPRALGNRSILADPRRKKMKDYINLEVKHRELFRPLAPSVTIESSDAFFNIDRPFPFMIVTTDVNKNIRETIPSVTHIDGTARPQTVSIEQNKKFHTLIEEFGHITGIPILLNTSFNNNGEPLVETPEDAINSFLKMKLDYLIIDNTIISKK
jgi:carbamoyltransferase